MYLSKNPQKYNQAIQTCSHALQVTYKSQTPLRNILPSRVSEIEIFYHDRIIGEDGYDWHSIPESKLFDLSSPYKYIFTST